MRVLRSTAVMLALIMTSAPRAASAQTQPAAIAPEHQEMAAGWLWACPNAALGADIMINASITAVERRTRMP